MKNEELPEVSKVTLKSVYSKERKLILEPAKDSRTGWYKGVERLSEEQKRKRKYWVDPGTSLTITHNYTFDLTDPVDKLNWEWVRQTNAIAMSFEECQNSKEALFYVDSEEIESRKSVSADEKMMKAMEHIFKDSPESLADRARILGHNMEDESPVIVKEFLLKMAKNTKTVQRVLDAYESNTTAVHLLFLKCRDKDIIRQENGAFIYGTSVLGVTQEAVLKYMMDPLNREMVLAIEKELKGPSNADSKGKGGKK